MCKQFKMIVSVLMMAVMLVTFSVPVMAAERTMENSAVCTQISETVDRRLVAGVLIGEFHYTGRLTKGKDLGIVDVTQAAKTVKWTVGRTGSTGTVGLEITNVSTGEVRHLTAVADNKLGSMTWVTALPAGGWRVKVDYVSSIWLYDVDLYFYT